MMPSTPVPRTLRLLVATILTMAANGSPGLAGDGGPSDRPAPAPAALPAVATIDDLLRFAAAHNPELAAAHARWEAALERIPQARALPDPQLGYGYFIRRMETRQVFRVEQMFPGFGKLRLGTDMATEAAAEAARQLEAQALRVRTSVLAAAADHAYLLSAVALIEQNLELVDRLADLARAQYRGAQASQADVLRLEMEADTLRTERESFHDRLRPSAARLNAVLGRAAATPLPRLPALEALVPPPAVRADPAISVDANPQLLAGDRAIRRAEKAHEFARRQGRPDFMGGVEFMDNRGMERDEVQAMVGITLPVWRGRYRAMEREAAAELRAARSGYVALRRELESDRESALFEVREAERSLRLFAEHLLPKARQTFQLIEAAYRTGDAGFLDLVGAQRALLEFELGHVRARAEHVRRLAEWEQLVGRDGGFTLPPHLNTEAGP